MTGLAIVTGGARGIGLAIVEALLDQGVVDRVASFDLVAGDSDRASNHACDVTDEASVRAAYDAVGEVPTVLVNNAGIMKYEDVSASRDLSDAEATIATNLLGPIRLIDAFVDHLKSRDNAAIINASDSAAGCRSSHSD